MSGDTNWGVFQSTNGGSTWNRIAYYPTGIYDKPTCMTASWDTFGKVYVGFAGNSFVYSQLASSPPSITVTSSSISPSTTDAPGAAVTYSATFKNTGGTLSNGNLGFRITNSAGTVVDQYTLGSVNLATNASQTITYTSTAPTTTGTYGINGGAWNSTWTCYYYNQLQALTDANVTTVTYEAEATANTLTNGAAIYTNSSASGGHTVGNLGGPSNGGDQFNGVTVSTAGSHSVKISYINGDSTARTAAMSINGGTATVVSFPSTGGYSTVGTITITVNLNSGSNTIKFSANGTAWCPDLDKIDVS